MKSRKIFVQYGDGLYVFLKEGKSRVIYRKMQKKFCFLIWKNGKKEDPFFIIGAKIL